MKERVYTVSAVTPNMTVKVRAYNEADALRIARQYGHNAACAWLSFGIMGIDYTESDIINNTKTPQP